MTVGGPLRGYAFRMPRASGSTRLRRPLGIAAAALIAATAGCAAPPSTAPGSVSSPPASAGARDDNPLSHRAFYVDPDTTAAAAAAASDPPIGELSAIAAVPQARWVDSGSTPQDVAAELYAFVQAARLLNQLPLLTLYAIPQRDCGGYSAGGFATGEQYRQWVRQVAAGVGAAPVAIVLEPDALSDTDCLSAQQREERAALLRDAVSTLTQNANAAVYIDGGNSRWLEPSELASRLDAVGVHHARGFSLNTSNFFTTAEEIAYGEQVSALLGGVHYVVDTSRNGAGPAPDQALNWCNPPGRALGSPPTTDTAGAHADAYLWIKNPGESDGSCDRGDPEAGEFMVPYAMELVRNSR